MMVHCLRMAKKPAFVLNPLKSMLNFSLERISLQKLEYEMERADLPDYYICFEIGYCGNPTFPYALHYAILTRAH